MSNTAQEGKSKKIVPLKSFLGKPLELKTGNVYYENELSEAIKKYEAQFFSQSDSKGWYENFNQKELEYLEESILDIEAIHPDDMKDKDFDRLKRLVSLKTKILPLSSKEESKDDISKDDEIKLLELRCMNLESCLKEKEGSKGREVEFAEWIDGKYDKESDDEYILKSDFQIPYKDEDCDPKTIKQLYEIFCVEFPETSKEESKAGFSEEDMKAMAIEVADWKDGYDGKSDGRNLHDVVKDFIQSLTPPTSKVEAKPEVCPDCNGDKEVQSASHEGSEFIPCPKCTAKPSQQEGEKKTAEEILSKYDNKYMNRDIKCSDSYRSYILKAMEEYANQFRPTDSKEAVELLDECRLQLEYLNAQPRGTTNSVLAKIKAFLSKTK